MAESRQTHLPDPAVDPEHYRAELIAIVGERDPVAVIEATPGRIRELLADQVDEALYRQPAEGEWSAAEIIGHLLDDEIINSFRLRQTLTTEQKPYPGTDPERWATLAKPPVGDMLAIWEGLRAYHVWLLKSLSATERSRIGMHDEQGAESVEMQILKNAGHDLAHIEQLERCLNG